MTTPLNPLSRLTNYGYAYGGPGFGSGGYRDDALLDGEWNFVYERDAHHGNHFTSTTAPYYETTGTTTTTTNANANASANTATAPAVTKTPVPVPLRTFRTVLLTTRACGRGLELGSGERVKMWSVRLSNKEKGSSIGGVKFDVSPRSTVNPTAKVETAGGGQEEEEGGDVKMDKESESKEEHENDGSYEAESSPAKRGVKGRGMVRVGRPKKVRITPPPPTAVTATTATAPPPR